MDGTENGELVPLLCLASAPSSFTFPFLPFFAPHPHSKAIFSILVLVPDSLKGIHSLALKPVTLLADLRLSLLSQEPSQQLPKVRILPMPSHLLEKHSDGTWLLGSLRPCLLSTCIPDGSLVFHVRIL